MVQNVCASQNFVSEFALHDYPLTEADILHKGRAAWDAALNTVNIGKYNLGWASIGICTHALYEAVAHAHNRRLYKMRVTDFPHVKRMFVDAYARLVAMKLFALRASDYMRSASPDDRRFPLQPDGEDEGDHRRRARHQPAWTHRRQGCEKSMYFEASRRRHPRPPKLEGTVNVNIRLIVSSCPTSSSPRASVPRSAPRDAANDALLSTRPAKGLGRIRFHDYHRALRSSWPNVKCSPAVEAVRTCLQRAAPTRRRRRIRLPPAAGIFASSSTTAPWRSPIYGRPCDRGSIFDSWARFSGSRSVHNKSAARRADGACMRMLPAGNRQSAATRRCGRRMC